MNEWIVPPRVAGTRMSWWTITTGTRWSASEMFCFVAAARNLIHSRTPIELMNLIPPRSSASWRWRFACSRTGRRFARSSIAPSRAIRDPKGRCVNTSRYYGRLVVGASDVADRHPLELLASARAQGVLRPDRRRAAAGVAGDRRYRGVGLGRPVRDRARPARADLLRARE